MGGHTTPPVMLLHTHALCIADPEEARVDAIYRAHGWHSFQQFLIFWGFLVMGILAGILIWLVHRSHGR